MALVERTNAPGAAGSPAAPGHKIAMGHFVLAGKRKISLSLTQFPSVEMLIPEQVPERMPWSHFRASLKEYVPKNEKHLAGRRVGIILPDPTRAFHPRHVLPPLAKGLGALSAKAEYFIALGLHRRLAPQELTEFLGPAFVRENRIIQHRLSDVRRFGTASGVPVSLNRSLLSADLLFTVSVVEPHLYAGFSGGVKGIAIGLAGKETILKTHSVAYLRQKSVRAGNIRTNPFQRFLWQAVEELNRPILSLNIVNNPRKQPVGYALGAARRSFDDAVRLARRVFACKVQGQFDLLILGCDHPKDDNLYQTSRLFNYVLEGRRLVRRGGGIVVFADLAGRGQSRAERNFEEALRKHPLPPTYPFSNPGEHRAFKVLEAARTARLCLVTPNPPRGPLSCLTVLSDQRALRRWITEIYGPASRIGVIPAGFSFVPTRS